MKLALKFKQNRRAFRWAVGASFMAILCMETSAGVQRMTSDLSYRIEKAQGVQVESVDGLQLVQGKGGFKLMLVPTNSKVWNMESISVLGLKFRNTGKTDLVLDLMLGNEGATDWSNSAIGRTIVKAGEAMPLGVVLCRSSDYAGTDSAYLRMSGKPDGSFRHWHTIDPTQVKSLVITCTQQGEHAFELSEMFPLQKMTPALMGTFPFIDQYGQYIHKEWPGKVHSNQELLNSLAIDKKLEKELGEPTGFTQYGGWKDGPEFEATGFFRTEKYKGKWWFIDPEGCLFWSYGMNCVGVEFAGQTPTERNAAIFQDLPSKDDADFSPFFTQLDVEDNYIMLEEVPHYDYTRANLFRKYGTDWEQQAIEQDIHRLKYCHLNTIGAWSDDAIATRKQVPYTAMIHYEYAFAAEKLPDPFDPETRAGLRKAIEEYPVPFKNDPWCLGAFVNNELHWKNDSRALVAEILGYKVENTEAKKQFQGWLENKYSTVSALNDAWQTQFTHWDEIVNSTHKSQFKAANTTDCAALTSLFSNAFFKMVKEELHRHAPNLLYLGSRMNSASEDVIRAAAEHVDVISANIYSYRPNPGKFGAAGKPVLISEFHFVNTSGSNLGSGLRSAQNSIQQGRLFSSFMEDAINHPQIIGAHWFQWRDQSVAGRYDGENYDVGFFDVADRPNVDLIRAAEANGRNLYNSIK